MAKQTRGPAPKKIGSPGSKIAQPPRSTAGTDFTKTPITQLRGTK